MDTASLSRRAQGIALGLSIMIATGYSTAGQSADDFASPVSDAELAAQRGRENRTVLNLSSAINQLDGELSDNVASGNTSGANVIRDGAFSNLKGHATVIQNSGNNNVIQDATIYNFSFNQ